jgi:hypothetical protein
VNARLALLALAISLCSCASGAKTPGARPRVTADEVRVSLRARRVGASISLEVEGRSQSKTAGAAFEDASRWRIRASDENGDLKRLVNGPTRVARESTLDRGEARWNTVVTFNVVYGLPKKTEQIDVVVASPSGQTITRSIPILD